MDKPLVFHKTQSVAQFKAEKNIEKLGIANTPKGKKCLFDGINVVGAVTTKKLTNPVISEVENEEGVRFNLLHNKGEGGLKMDVVL
jgi:hypothetical protein